MALRGILLPVSHPNKGKRVSFESVKKTISDELAKITESDALDKFNAIVKLLQELPSALLLTAAEKKVIDALVRMKEHLSANKSHLSFVKDVYKPCISELNEMILQAWRPGATPEQLQPSIQKINTMSVQLRQPIDTKLSEHGRIDVFCGSLAAVLGAVIGALVGMVFGGPIALGVGAGAGFTLFGGGYWLATSIRNKNLQQAGMKLADEIENATSLLGKPF
jgi:hypothetical protein